MDYYLIPPSSRLKATRLRRARVAKLLRTMPISFEVSWQGAGINFFLQLDTEAVVAVLATVVLVNWTPQRFVEAVWGWFF